MIYAVTARCNNYSSTVELIDEYISQYIPEIFQTKITQIFGDIPGLVIYFDDVGISGKTTEDYDKKWSLVLQRAQSNVIKVNNKKNQYYQYYSSE